MTSSLLPPKPENASRIVADSPPPTYPVRVTLSFCFAVSLLLICSRLPLTTRPADFVQSSKLTRGTESDHRNISKVSPVQQRSDPPRSDILFLHVAQIAGAIWRTLPPEQKLAWHEKAAKEKADHQLLYPGYRCASATCRIAHASFQN